MCTYPLQNKRVAMVTEANKYKCMTVCVYTLHYILHHDRICSEVIAGIVTKCLNARAKTKDCGINVCLMYIEIEKQDTVVVSRHVIYIVFMFIYLLSG